MARDRVRWTRIDPSHLPEDIRIKYEEMVAAWEAFEQARRDENDPASANNEIKRKAPCSNCRTKTSHNVLHVERRIFDETFELIECAGCGRISFAHTYLVTRDSAEERWTDYYPSPVSRPQPWWLAELRLSGPNIDYDLRSLFAEIYEALWGGQHRLAVMGIRALLERLMVLKVGDQGSFARTLKEFCEKGFIPKVQHDAISAVLDAGHAAMHRMYKPTEVDLNTALDIAEGIFSAIYVHIPAAAELSDRVPSRKTTGKVIPWKDFSSRRPAHDESGEGQ
jgi:hypothetical protein